mgnify:CR=1 FL=1
MTTQEKFEHTRDLEKQVVTLQATIKRCLSKINEMDRTQTFSERDLEVVTNERDSWKDKACELQLN